MAEGARVDAIETLQSLKIALVKFAEAANVALADAEGEMRRTQTWLQTEARSHWESELRKRTEALSRAKEALRDKKMFKDATGRTPSAVDEEKAVRIAQRNLEEAEQKIVAVRRHTMAIQKEIQIYQGAVQRFANTVQLDVPLATAQLEKMFGQLEAYVSLRAAAPGEAIGEAVGAGGGGVDAPPDVSMARRSGWPSAPEIDPLAIRRHSPSPRRRRTARAGGDVSLVRWQIGTLSDQQRDSVGEIDLPMESADRLTLVVSRRSLERSHLYLERLEPTGDKDSGWYLGPSDADADDPCEIVAIEDLLRSRPDLRELLRLPEGCLALLGVNGLERIFDRGDNRRWPS